ncbi:beta-L-arabinofuranosidase domain-containing protein [Nocardioides sp. GCM10030258]|uniref:beta-L-arabinofuranosidase domain-containing protein n=1 Tax=unclassified Nocardioides TaxID=2615069 RepID=UPI00361CBD26
MSHRVATVATILLTLVGVFALPPAPAAAASVLDHPALLLSFEDDLVDASGAAVPVEARKVGGGAPSYSFVEGVTSGSRALQLTSGTYLDLGTSVALQPAALTVSFWLKPATAMAGEQVITWSKQAYNSDGWYLSSEGNSSPLALSVGPGGAQPYKLRVTSSDRATFFPAGQWTHVAVSYDSATKQASFYRNGIRVPSQVAQPVAGASTGVITGTAALPKTIGFNGPQYNGAFLASALDQYGLYTGVASTADVATLYEQGGGSLDKEALAQAAADDINVPDTATVGLALPSEAANGAEITWASSDPDVIGTDGSVHPPGDGEADAEVTLTATVRYADGDPVTRTFVVVVPAPREVLEDSGLGVRVDDDYLNNAAAKEQEYLTSLDSGKFLFWFHKTAGLTPPTASGYSGWEDGSTGGNFRGHAFGHYMSALALSWAGTPDTDVRTALRAEIDQAVAGLAEVQATYAGTVREGYVGPFRDSALDAVEGRGTSNDPVIVPYYNLHKVLAGLLDIDKYVGGATGDQALSIAEGFGEYLHGRVSTLSDTSVMLRTEYGGMNDALYELYVRSGGNPHFNEAAEAFDEVSLFRQLANGQDVLSGKHANTTIPKLIGALKRYTVFTQDPELYATLSEQEKADLPMYLQAAQNFWQIVIDDHTYATGSNSQAEHFHDPESLHEFAAQKGATGNAETSETCNEYNMLKLSRELFKLTQDVKYADYYENTFLNHIVSSQNPETGMTTYFQAMAPGYYKLYSLPYTLFWCCTGTGMENFSKLGDSMYFTGTRSVWVNLFFSSRFEDAETNLAVTQEADLPTSDTVTFRIGAADGGQVAADAQLRLRVPDWVVGGPALAVNGSEVAPTIDDGYVVLTGLVAGDVVTYRLPMKVEVIATPDNADFFAFRYGPAVLSAGLGTRDLDKYNPVGILVRVPALDPEAQQTIVLDAESVQAWKDDIADNLVRVADSADGQVQFELRNTVDGEGLVFTPHYRRHDERYGLYFSYEVKDSAAAQQRILDAKERLREDEIVIDSLDSFDNNNFENAKNLKASSTSSVGTFNGRQFRHAPGPDGWFSYDLEVDPAQAQNFLRTRYYSGDQGRSFDVYLNDVKLKTQTITTAAGTNVFHFVTDEIPRTHLDNPRWKVDANGDPVLDGDGQKIPVVTVRFQSTGGWAGGVFGVATTGPQEYDDDARLVALAAEPGDLAPAFSPDVAAYTLTVPAGTDEVDLDLDPRTPSGLVKVDGVLVDDTRPRTVELQLDGPTTVQVQAFAQDHVTSTTYTVTVVQGDGPAPVATVRPSIAGTAQVGHKLKATIGTWDVPGVSGTIQWLANGSPVVGATGSSYQVRRGDVGKRLSVRVTATVDGRAPGSADSAATAVVRRGASRMAVTTSRSVVPRGRAVIVTTRIAATGLVATGRVSVYDNGRLVARPALVNGVARVALRPRRSGRHLIVVRYAGASWIAPSRDWTTIRVRRATSG